MKYPVYRIRSANAPKPRGGQTYFADLMAVLDNAHYAAECVAKAQDEEPGSAYFFAADDHVKATLTYEEAYALRPDRIMPRSDADCIPAHKA